MQYFIFLLCILIWNIKETSLYANVMSLPWKQQLLANTPTGHSINDLRISSVQTKYNYRHYIKTNGSVILGTRMYHITRCQ